MKLPQNYIIVRTMAVIPERERLIRAEIPFLNSLRQKTRGAIDNALGNIFPYLQTFGIEGEKIPSYTDPNIFSIPRHLTMETPPAISNIDSNVRIPRLDMYRVFKKERRRKVSHHHNTLIIECKENQENTGVELHAFENDQNPSARIIYRNFSSRAAYFPSGDRSINPIHVYNSHHEYRNDTARRSLEELALASFADQALHDTVGHGFLDNDQKRLEEVLEEWKNVTNSKQQLPLHPGIIELIPLHKRDLFAPVVVFPSSPRI